MATRDHVWSPTRVCGSRLWPSLGACLGDATLCTTMGRVGPKAERCSRLALGLPFRRQAAAGLSVADAGERDVMSRQ